MVDDIKVMEQTLPDNHEMPPNTLTSMEIANSSPMNGPIKDDLVSTAVTFLQNPAVATRPQQEKYNFLIKKGLSDQEISTAIMRAENTMPAKGVGQSTAMTYDGFVAPLVPQRAPMSVWSTVKSTANVLVFVSSAAYGCHLLYQWILKTYFKGQISTDRLQPLLEYQNRMTNMMETLQTSLENLKLETANQNKLLEELLRSQRRQAIGEREDLISELSNIKSLLLNRGAFPAAPATGVSLPEWQRLQVKSESELDRSLVANGHDLSPINDNELNNTNNESHCSSDSFVSSTLNGSEQSESEDKLDLSVKDSMDETITLPDGMPKNC